LEEWPQKIVISASTDAHFPDGADVFARYLYEANLLRPDLIFSTGDVLEDEKLATGWGYFQDVLEWQEVPAFFVPGNHDHSSGGRFYQKYAGPTNFSVVIGDFDR
jgi:3',5'-cyclic AMP phosphodiesterase CpdA